MNRLAKIRPYLIDLVILLYMLLFTYAAVSKLLDYEDFSIKIGQSPLLSAFAGVVAIGVPVLELLLVVLLCFPRLRISALFASFCLMIMFTAYIYIILNYSHYVPCSCGGVLQDLGWTEHLIFNLAFIVLALGVLLSDDQRHNWMCRLRPLHFALVVSGGALLSVASVVGLYVLSDDILETQQPFIRRFADRSVPEYQKLDLGFNSYYFAGIDKGTLYLGNSTAPLQLSLVDTGLTRRERVTLELDRLDFPFRSLVVMVVPPYFYMADGTVPSLHKGSITDWKARYLNKPMPYSSAFTALDTARLALRRTSLVHRSQALELYALTAGDTVTGRYPLPKQADGLFDTDGLLLYNPALQSVHYLYLYRNQYLTFDRDLKLTGTGRTIDTLATAALKVAYTQDGTATMAAPPVTVNKHAAVYQHLLFIHSERIGKYEGKKILQHASIIDVYDLTQGRYISSFYVYHVGKEKMRSFRVEGSSLYTLTGNSITAVRLPPTVLNALHQTKTKPNQTKPN